MPKKKTGQRKKAEKQKLRQKEIRANKDMKPLADWACNSNMVCCVTISFSFRYDLFSYSLFVDRRNVTDVKGNRKLALFVTFANLSSGCQCVATVAK